MVSSILRLSNILSETGVVLGNLSSDKRVLIEYQSDGNLRHCLIDVYDKCAVCWYCEDYKEVLSALKACFKTIVVPMLVKDDDIAVAEDRGYQKLNTRSLLLRFSIPASDIDRIEALREEKVYKGMLELLGIDTADVRVSNTIYGCLR